MNKMKFLPSFKDKGVADELCIDIVNQKETNMQLFKIKSDLFVEDVNMIPGIKKALLHSLCEEIVLVDNNILIFKLNNEFLKEKKMK